MPKHRGNHDPSPAPSWRFTKVMNMSDLSRDDDFLSHLFVEKLGTGSVPLFVHKMDSSRRLPKTDTNDILQIVRRVRSFLPHSPHPAPVLIWTQSWSWRRPLPRLGFVKRLTACSCKFPASATSCSLVFILAIA